MRKILPLNIKPSIRTCIHHAYPCAIIESKELAYVRVNDYDSREWQELLQDTTIQREKDEIKIVGKDHAAQQCYNGYAE